MQPFSEHIREQVLDTAEGVEYEWGRTKRGIFDYTEENSQKINEAANKISVALQQIIAIMTNQTNMAATNNRLFGTYAAGARDHMAVLLEDTVNADALSAIAHLDAAHAATETVQARIGATNEQALTELNAKGVELLGFLGHLSRHALFLPFLDMEQIGRAAAEGNAKAPTEYFYGTVQGSVSQATGSLRQFAEEL